MVDAYVGRYGYPALADELSGSIAARYRYIKAVQISTLRYLARVWQILEAADPALVTAETMLEYHQRAMPARRPPRGNEPAGSSSTQEGPNIGSDERHKGALRIPVAQPHTWGGDRNKAQRRRVARVDDQRPSRESALAASATVLAMGRNLL